MHDARVMIRNRILIVLARRTARHDGLRQQRGAVEGGAEAGDEGASFDVGVEGEGTGGAAEDVGGGWFGEGQATAKVEEVGGRVDLAGYGAPDCLGVDGELFGGVLGEDLVDVVLVVAAEEGGVEGDAVVGA